MTWTHLRDTHPVARRIHQCSLCERHILVGERHVYRVGRHTGDPLLTSRMHERCERLAAQMYDDDDGWDCHDAVEFRRVLEEQDEARRASDAPVCRRCSECRGARHHWLDNGDFGNDPDEAEDPVDVTHVCKHCPALGMECEACEGTGSTLPLDEINDWIARGEDPPQCSACGGEGVIEVTRSRDQGAPRP